MEPEVHQEAGSKLLIYIDQHCPKLSSKVSLNEYLVLLDLYFKTNWDRIIQASCRKYNLTEQQLYASILENL